ncbi:MAG: AAA domain-containing protein [Ktedonobacteraceae bacterium]
MFKTDTGRVLSLAQMLDEMKEALTIEIKVRENEGASKAHQAIGGKAQGEQSGRFRYLYTFSLLETWEFHDDTLIKIRLNVSSEIKGTIVSSNGSSISIATEKSLPYEAYQMITFYDDSIELVKSLKGALSSNKEGDLHLASKTFGLEFPKSGKASSSISATVFQPDASQQKAIQMALGNEVTYIIGPPGTGKTVTLATVALENLLAGRTILIAAHTNIAVDNAIKQLADFCKKPGTINYLREERIVRFGAVQLADLQKPEYEYVYLPEIVKHRSAIRHKEKGTLEARLKELEGFLLTRQSENEQKRKNWKTERQQLRTQYQISKNELISLRESEKQRIARLNAEKTELENQHEQVRQASSFISQQLASQVSRKVHMEHEKGQFLIQQKDISERLAIAQQMNKLMLVIKRLNPDKLAQHLVKVNQQIWGIDNEKRRLEVEINNGHSQNNYLLQQDHALISQIHFTSSQLRPSPDVIQKTDDLQKIMPQIDQLIKNGDYQLRVEANLIGEYKTEKENISQQLENIQKGLNDLEKSIVSEAQVVATTLSKLYIDPALGERRFDIVIIDEVSMAPLPAIYVAASRANNSVIAVGDPQQLAPINNVKDKAGLNNHEIYLTKTWLGTDLFGQNKITLEDAHKESGNNISTILTHQSRMHSEISAIARKHIYNIKKEILQDQESRIPKDQLSQVKPFPGKHLILCDTSDASPITIKPKSSRINIYHALCSVAIARQALLSLPDNHKQEVIQRIGIVTPYKKQSKLLQSLIIDAGLKEYIRVGTVHKFQGLEFDVVIFDTVESPPISPRFDFIAGGKDTEALRLVNVAVTRARHKLIIVANAKHIQTAPNRDGYALLFPENSILRKAVAEAQKSGVIHSLDLLGLPSTSSSTTLEKYSNKQQSDNMPGQSLSDIELLYEERLNEKTFYPRFILDVQSARKEIVIVSPYLANRIKELLPFLEAKRKEGISVIVIINPQNQMYGFKNLLEQANIKVLEYSKAHMKHAFIDGEIIYDGSLNILSHKDTHESMIRKKSPKAVKMVWGDLYKEITKENHEQLEQTIQSKKLPEHQGTDIQIIIHELSAFQSRCIHCSGEMVPNLNGKTRHPFYGCKNWKNRDHPRYTINVEDDHLMCIPSLNSIICKCNNMMQPKKFGDASWLECAGETSCGYWRNIIFTK